MEPKKDEHRGSELDLGGTLLGHERRAEQRIPHRAIVVMPFGEGVSSRFENATLLDCTAHGVALIVSQQLKPRSRFFLKLKLTAVALVIYEVRHCQEVPEGYRIGAEFRGVIGNAVDRESAPETILAALLRT